MTLSKVCEARAIFLWTKWTTPFTKQAVLSLLYLNKNRKKKTRPCPACPKPTEGGEVLTIGNNALYSCTTLEPDRRVSSKVQVWDGIESRHLYHCAKCGELWYVGEKGTCIRECEACGKAFCPECFGSNKSRCPECEAIQARFKAFIEAHIEEIKPLLTLADVKVLKKTPLLFAPSLRTYVGLLDSQAAPASFIRGTAFFHFKVETGHSYLMTVRRVGGDLVPSEKDKYKFRLEGIE